MQRCSQIWKIVRWEASKMMSGDFGLGPSRCLQKRSLSPATFFSDVREASQSPRECSLKTPSLTKHEILIDSKCQDCSRAFLDLIADGLSPETVPNVRSWLVWSQRSQWGPWLRKCFSSRIAIQAGFFCGGLLAITIVSMPTSRLSFF